MFCKLSLHTLDGLCYAIDVWLRHASLSALGIRGSVPLIPIKACNAVECLAVVAPLPHEEHLAVFVEVLDGDGSEVVAHVLGILVELLDVQVLRAPLSCVRGENLLASLFLHFACVHREESTTDILVALYRKNAVLLNLGVGYGIVLVLAVVTANAYHARH